MTIKKLISAAIGMAFTASIFAADIDVTSKVSTASTDWGGGVCSTSYAPAAETADGRADNMVEKYETTVETTGILLSQTITNLTNGSYTVSLYANACYTPDRGFESTISGGETDIAYVFAYSGSEESMQKAYITTQIATSTAENGVFDIDIEVTDGTLTLGLAKDLAGTNWHTINIKSLTLHTSDNEVVTAAKEKLKEAIDNAKTVSPVPDFLSAEISNAQDIYSKSTDPDEILEAANQLKATTILAINTNSVSGASESNPVATDFIINGTFDNSTSPWLTTTGAQNRALASNQQGAFDVPFFENWNPSNFTGKIYQTVSNIPNGSYRLDISAFTSTLSTNSQFVYANNIKVPLSSDTPTAYSVYVYVKDNTIEVGMEQTSAVSNWIGIDNVALYYLSADDITDKYNLDNFKSILEAAVEAANAFDMSTIPAAMANKIKSTVASNNITYSTAEGYMTAASNIYDVLNSASVLTEEYADAKKLQERALAVDFSNKQQNTEEAESALKVFQNSCNTLNDRIDACLTEEELNNVMQNFRQDIYNYISVCSPAKDASWDISFITLNDDVSGMWTDTWSIVVDGWTNGQSSGNFQLMYNEEATADGEAFMEYWTSTAVSNNGFTICKKINLPAGKYTANARAFARQNDNNGTTRAVVFTVDDFEGVPVDNEVLGWVVGEGEAGSGVSFTLSEAKEVTIGVKGCTDNCTRWMGISRITLTADYQEIPVESITPEEKSIEMNVGDSKVVTPVITPENATSGITWTSSDNNVVAVSDNGKSATLKAIAEGKATITITANDDSKATASFIVNVSSTAEQQWIDVTQAFLTNPNFDNNSTEGWTAERNGGNFNKNYECVEFWNSTSFNFFQTIENIPNGKYRLSAQAYYRSGDSNELELQRYEEGTNDLYTVLYANDEEMPVASMYSAYYDYNVANGCWQKDERWYTNGMSSVSVAFTDGLYPNSVEFEVSDGTATIGLRKEGYNHGDWAIFDEFKLEILAPIKNVETISLSLEKTTINIGEYTQASATVGPDDATIKKYTFESSNTDVATVDANGLVYALNTGETIITATALDGSGVKGSATLTIIKGDVSSENIVINEIMASDIDMFMSGATNFDGWIEIYNPTNSVATLAGCYMTDDDTNPKKWLVPSGVGSVPANGYKVVWFDHSNVDNRQATFKLDVDGGYISIYDADGNLLSSQTYPASKIRTAYARTTDGGDTWGYTADPTPGESNATSTFASEQLEAPVVDKESTFFTGKLNIKITVPQGATLVYTEDGTLPTLENGNVCKGELAISNTASLRFRLFADGYLPSNVTTRSYILKPSTEYTIPVVSIVADPDYIYSNEYGIYVQGTNGRPGNGQDNPCNWNMDWERPVNMSYILPDGSTGINQDVFMAVAGGWSRSWEPRPFKLKGNKVFGIKSLNYQFFEDKPYIKSRTLQLRNGGNDTGCMFRDPALQQIMSKADFDIDCQAYQPVFYYINGDFKGFINLREPNNKHFVEANYGWGDDEIDQFEIGPDSGYFQSCGTEEAFLRLYDLTSNAADEDTYKEIGQLLDVDEYINYMAVQMYLGNWDWPQNNVKGYRNRKDGKFRFVVYDLDGAFSTNDPFGTFAGKQTYTFDRLRPSGDRITAEIKFVTIFLNLLDNETFRKQFIDTYSIIAGSVFDPVRCNKIIDDMVENVSDMMSIAYKSPNPTANNLKNSLNGRLSQATTALKNYWKMELSGTNPQSVKLQSDTEGAKIFINGIHVPTDYFNGNLFYPAKIRVEAPAGYKFAYWAGEGLSDPSAQTEVFPDGSDWKYYDQGSLDDTGWQDVAYDDSDWMSGISPLGYSSDNSAFNTVLSYGDNYNYKNPTYYFRKTVTLHDTPSDNNIIYLNTTIDDGAIVYVNGVEAGRYNMHTGTATYDTYASTYANNNPDHYSIRIDPGLLTEGDNIIAVEIHNCNNNSSDIYWDANMTIAAIEDMSITTAEFDMPESGTIDVTAFFTEMTETEKKNSSVNPVRINEISASNNRYVNEYYKRNDWVELYNTTDTPVDVEGMYLTDNVKKPKKYQISKGATSTNTVIPAHGHLIIWCDKLATESQLHASFKLNSEENYIMLTAADESWADTVKYHAHDENYTVGRYPDGGNNVYLMNVQTIGYGNILSLNNSTWVENNTNYEEPVEEKDTSIVIAYNITRETGLGNTSQTIDADLAEALEFLGISDASEAEVLGINPSDSSTVANAMNTFDGWRNKTGDFVKKGANAAVCVKFDPTLDKAQFYDIMDMGNDNVPTAGETFTAKWALKKDKRAVVFNINIKFVKPSVPDNINSIAANLKDSPQDIYNVNGIVVRKKATSLNGLASGIYIINGRKYLVE